MIQIWFSNRYTLQNLGMHQRYGKTSTWVSNVTQTLIKWQRLATNIYVRKTFPNNIKLNLSGSHIMSKPWAALVCLESIASGQDSRKLLYDYSITYLTYFNNLKPRMVIKLNVFNSVRICYLELVSRFWEPIHYVYTIILFNIINIMTLHYDGDASLYI